MWDKNQHPDQHGCYSVGRLIRSKTDEGIVAILDNRVLTKRYDRAFIESLPQCPVEIV